MTCEGGNKADDALNERGDPQGHLPVELSKRFL